MISMYKFYVMHMNEERQSLSNYPLYSVEKEILLNRKPDPILSDTVCVHSGMSVRNNAGAWGSAEKNMTHVARMQDDTEVVPFSMSDLEDSYEIDQETKVCKFSPVQSPCRPPAGQRELAEGKECEEIFTSDDEEDEGKSSEDGHRNLSSPSKIAPTMVVEDFFEEEDGIEDIDLRSWDEKVAEVSPIRESKQPEENARHVRTNETAPSTSPSKGFAAGERVQAGGKLEEKSDASDSTVALKIGHSNSSMAPSVQSEVPRETFKVPMNVAASVVGLEAGATLSQTYLNGYCRKDGQFTRCIVKRSRRGIGGMKTRFIVYLQHYLNTNRKTGPAVPILAAEKQVKCKTPNFHIFDISNDSSKRYLEVLNKKESSYVGKLRVTFDGTEATLYGSELYRQQYAAILFDGKKKKVYRRSAKPRSCRVFLPVLDQKGCVDRSMCTSKAMVDTLKDKVEDDDMASEDETKSVILGNKLPQYSRGAYRLHFGGRTKMASVKNFQLSRVADVHKGWQGSTIPDDVVLQLGKRSKNKFHMDFKAPMSAFQAFGICLSQFTA
jgi:hypothetical protein